MRERPTFVPIWLACRHCRHAWDDWQPQDVPVETWVAHVKTYRCPRCGADAGHVVLRAKPIEGDRG